MSGLYGMEREIMALWDSGQSVQQIDSATPYALNTIKAVINRFAPKAEDAWQVDAAMASDALADAVQRCIQNGGAG